MRFSAFYVLCGALIGIASVKTTSDEANWGWLFAAGMLAAVIGAAFEVGNPRA